MSKHPAQSSLGLIVPAQKNAILVTIIRRLKFMTNANSIRLILFDVDGVLTHGEGAAFDLPLMEQLAGLNRAARADPNLPAVTVCTGRPAPYVDAILQAIDGHVPGIFENGAGLYVPDGYQFLSHPDLRDNSALPAIRQRLDQTLIKTGQAYFQPGKEHTLTLFAHNPAETARLADWVLVVLDSLAEAVDLVYSPACLNILPRGMHKGRGLEFLAEQTGYTPVEMLGVGDSAGDMQFLTMVGTSAAPANAMPVIKELVDYVAPHAASDGVRDILAYFGLS
jgi:hydroxymethylpyrimidine pyrophosphatase-like HAD family hydrolase